MKMTTKSLTTIFVSTVVALCGCSKKSEPALPRAEAHCASGLGNQALCAEWAGALGAAQQECTTLGGQWNEQPCPATVTSSGGTCVIVAADHTGTLHYASGWRSRAEAHCTLHHGKFRAPR